MFAAGELDLQLHFISFKSGIKVKVTLDLSFLNRYVFSVGFLNLSLSFSLPYLCECDCLVKEPNHYKKFILFFLVALLIMNVWSTLYTYRGVYPWEIIPSVCAAGADGTKHTDEALLGDVENAVKSIKPGYMRIIQLCRCISKAIQSSSRWIYWLPGLGVDEMVLVSVLR